MQITCGRILASAAIILLCAGLTSCNGLSSSEASTPAVKLDDTEQHSITSAKIGQRYDLLVSLPAGYARSATRYPVLYVLDGWHFPLMAFLQNNNRFSGRMPPVIIVNISHGPGNYMAMRARDFTPTRTSIEAGSGGAPAFLDFFEHELIPYVDRFYRTVPADRALLGHSYGGLFALYALEQRPALFQRIVAASPITEWDDGLLLKSATNALRQLPAPVRLDVSVGGDEDDNTKAAFDELKSVLDKARPARLDYKFTMYPGENHNSVRLRSFPEGLNWVYASGQ
jgi:predicted alpha/beta superfamily hydrolase